MKCAFYKELLLSEVYGYYPTAWLTTTEASYEKAVKEDLSLITKINKTIVLSHELLIERHTMRSSRRQHKAEVVLLKTFFKLFC